MTGLNAADHHRIVRAVTDAEAGTDGEIMPVVARRSDGYADIAFAAAGLSGALLLLTFAAWPAGLMALVHLTTRGWATGLGWTLAILAITVFLVALVVLLVFGATPLRYRLVPARIRQARVRARALALFRMGAEARTVRRTGIVIYVSLAEHCAEIVADRAIHERVPPEAWGEAMAALVGALREGRLADGMVAAIAAIGDILHHNLPRRDDDKDELPNRLIEL